MNTSETIANLLTLAGLAAIALMLRKKANDDEQTPAEALSYPNPTGATRGLRNNNPLNIEKTSTVWQGEIRPGSDPRFAQFQSMPYGYRAAFKTINTYITKYGLDTVASIIGRWDPGSTNYVNVVCQYTGMQPTTKITPGNESQLINLVSAMSRMENGIPANSADVRAGWSLSKV